MGDEFFLDLAISEAWKYFGLTYPNPPVGSLITIDDKIISINCHKKYGEPHAEVNAIKDAYYKLTNDQNILNITDATKLHEYLYRNHNNIFKNATIYVTLEPCNHYGKTPPCAILIENLGFKRVVIGTLENNTQAEGGAKRLQNSGIDVVSGMLKEECDSLLAIFNKTINNEKFVFFKYAQKINGVIDGGYISSKESLKLVHNLRDKCDLLVIGGNSVRVDRPTLDARMIDGKAPDILILSNQKDFDKSIPLFNVPNREVYISDSLDIIDRYKFVMVEGGSKMLQSFSKIADFLLLFQAPSIKSGGYKIDADINLETKYFSKIGVDLYMWSKIIV
jgi:diaminohydroxyphosphoribosylaminopyrimidine deaminase/5-amino-6-(5-phosphoribosylamino)uracil reductase